MDFAYNYLVNDLGVSGNVVLGCSGGPDSMALLSLLLDIRGKFPINIIVAHVNHKVRVESDDEEKFLREYCHDVDVIFEFMKIDSYSSDNFESEARHKRYQFFDRVVNKYDARYLFTAHHGDDLVETILMRISRGSTLQGYSGFSLESIRNGYSIIRPLIHMTKDEILDYDNNRGIPFVIDKTNFLDVHTRNKFRKYVLPTLKDINVDVVDKFYKFSDIVSRNDEFINRFMLNEYSKVVSNGVIDISLFLLQDLVIGERIIRKYLCEFYSDLSCVNDKHVDMILNIISSSRSNCSICLPGGFVGVKEYDSFKICNNIDFSDYDFEFSDMVSLFNGKCIEKVKNTSVNDNNVIRLCSGDLCLPLHVRSRKNGDRIHIKGMDGSRKVSDVFIDCKVPVRERLSWPIVVDSNDVIVWIPGLKKSFYDTNLENCDIILRYY